MSQFMVSQRRFFLECLILPDVEVVRILSMGPVIPRLISMISSSHEPCLLRKLALRTIPLQGGESSALLISPLN